MLKKWNKARKKQKRGKRMRSFSPRALGKTQMNESKRKSIQRRSKNDRLFIAQSSLFHSSRGFTVFSCIVNISFPSDVSLRRELKNKNKWVNCWLGLRRIWWEIWVHTVTFNFILWYISESEQSVRHCWDLRLRPSPFNIILSLWKNNCNIKKMIYFCVGVKREKER